MMNSFKSRFAKLSPVARIILGTLASLSLSIGFVEIMRHLIALQRQIESPWIAIPLILAVMLIWVASYLIPASLVLYGLKNSFEHTVVPRVRLAVILISYVSVIFSFAGMYFSMCAVADYSDAIQKYIHYYFQEVRLRSHLQGKIRYKGDERAFRGIEQRLWSGVDWPIDANGQAELLSDEADRISPDQLAERAYNATGPDAAEIAHFIPKARVSVFMDCIHFSVDTVTTLGYGDITPHAWYAKLAADIEALSGLALLVVALGMLFGNWSATHK
jgi:Ion channel